MFVTESDRPRFKELNVVAEVSPYLWYPFEGVEGVVSAVGESRMKTFYTIKSFLRDGIEVAAGSDWPSASPTLNPWIGFGTMVTRQNPSAERSDTLGGNEAVTVAEALQVFTIGGARVLNKENECGTLEVGMSADMAVLDRDIFAVACADIAGTVVELTVFEGKIVFDKQEQN